MNKEELIGKLQMVYVGDKNALNELIGYCDGLKEVIEIVQQENKILKENAENNDKVIDKVNWENMLLKKENKQLKEEIEEYKNPIKYFKYANKNVTEENKQLKDRDLIIAAELTKLQDENIRLKKESQKQKEVIDKAIEYINKYAWQEDIIGGIYTTNGKPATDRYMRLEWDNCNELLEILKGDSNE